jgi:hypothetical protein
MHAALRRFAAILTADLRERLRSPRFWILLTAMVVVTWYCFPAPEAGYFVLAPNSNERGAYSSAWIGLVLAMAYSLLLGMGGFYMVRGTLVRDFETRVWQLLVTTPMTRAGFLLAKWASHMLVFAVLVGAGLVVGLVAQFVRAEDRHLDLIEAIKPILILSLPGLSTTAALAVWFDLVPWLRRTAGNVLFFIFWIATLSMGVSQLEVEGSPARTTWVSDAHGLMLVARDFQRVRTEQTGKPQDFGFNLGTSRHAKAITLFDWKTWHPRPMDVAGRSLWLGFSLVLVLLGAPFLDRAAASSAGMKSRATGGARLRLLDPLLRPFARGSFGVLAVAELKLALRERRLWWWLAAVVLLCVQAFGSASAMMTAMLLAWGLPLDLLARGALREGEHRTGELVFTAPRMLGRLLAVRLVVPLAMLVGLTLPALVRLSSLDPLSALTALVVATSIASWGLAFGAICRNPRPFELLMVASIYIALQGPSLFSLQAQAAQTLSWHALALLPAWALLAWGWPRLAQREAR